MSLTRWTLRFSLLFIGLSAWAHAQDGMENIVQQAPDAEAQNYLVTPQDAQQDSSQGLPPQGQDGQNPYPQQPQGEAAQGQQDPTPIQGQQGQTRRQGQDQQVPDPNRLPVQQDATRLQQGQTRTQGQDPYRNQRQDPNSVQGTQDTIPMQQGQTRTQGQDLNRNPRQGQQDPSGQTQTQGQDLNRNPRQGQQDPSGQTQMQGQPGQPLNNQGQGETRDQLPPDGPRGQPQPQKPKVLPRPVPAPTPSPTFSPAPPPPPPVPEPAARPQSSAPKTTEQRSYESAMQTRWKAAADEIALLKSRGEALQGKKGKAFRESLRTASGNRSMARTKLNQLIRAPSADFDKLKTGVERAFADLDSSIERVRSYFEEPTTP